MHGWKYLPVDTKTRLCSAQVKSRPEHWFKYNRSFLNSSTKLLWSKKQLGSLIKGPLAFKGRWREGKLTNLLFPSSLQDELFKRGIDSYQFPDLSSLSDSVCAERKLHVPSETSLEATASP